MLTKLQTLQIENPTITISIGRTILNILLIITSKGNAFGITFIELQLILGAGPGELTAIILPHI